MVLNIKAFYVCDEMYEDGLIRQRASRGEGVSGGEARSAAGGLV